VSQLSQSGIAVDVRERFSHDLKRITMLFNKLTAEKLFAAVGALSNASATGCLCVGFERRGWPSFKHTILRNKFGEVTSCGRWPAQPSFKRRANLSPPAPQDLVAHPSFELALKDNKRPYR